jgi:hypothetical protein
VRITTFGCDAPGRCGAFGDEPRIVVGAFMVASFAAGVALWCEAIPILSTASR